MISVEVFPILFCTARDSEFLDGEINITQAKAIRMPVLVLVLTLFISIHHVADANTIVFKDKGVFAPLISDEHGKPVYGPADPEAEPIEEVVLPQRAPIPAGPDDIDIMPEVPTNDCPPGKIKIAHTNQGDSECVDPSVGGLCGSGEIKEMDESGNILCVPKRSGQWVYVEQSTGQGQVIATPSEISLLACFLLILIH